MKRDRGIASGGIALLLAVAGLLAPAHAQEPDKVARIGFLSLSSQLGLAHRGVE